MERFITEKAWREPASPTTSAKRPPYLRRFLFLIATLVLLVLLWTLLVRPLKHPDTHLVLMVGGKHRPLTIARLPFADRDAERISALGVATAAQTVSDFSGMLRTPQQLRRLGGALQRLDIGQSDVLLVYVAAQCVSFQGEAYLLSNDFDPARPTEGRIPLASLLSQIRSAPAKAKLLLLDAGNVDFDPRLGVVANEFPRLLSQTVKRSRDSSLWVLTSHSQFEYSQRSPPLAGSVFAVFVEKGLRGAADRNEDQVVDLAELTGFVQSHVASWVNQRTGGTQTQIPMLVCGDESIVPSSEWLMATRQFSPESRSVDVRDLVGATDNAGVIDAWIDLSDPRRLPRGVLSRSVEESEAATASASGQNGASDSPSDATAPEGEATTPDSVADANESGNGSEVGEQGGTNPTSSTDLSRDSLRLLVDGWQLHDDLSSGSPRETPNSFPDQYPHLYRELQLELIEFERQLRGGDEAGARAASQRLRMGTAEIRKDLSADDQATSRMRGSAAADDVQFSDAILSTGSFALRHLLADYGAADPNLSREEIDGLLSQDTDQAFRAWITSSWKEEYEQFYELRLLKQLADLSDVDWPLLRLAGRARRLAEQTAADSLGTSLWTEERIIQADRLRLAGERQLFDRIGADWKRQASDHLRLAVEHYKTIQSDQVVLGQTITLRNQFVLRAPSYVRWHRLAASDSGSPSPTYDQLLTFLDGVIRLSRLLAVPEEQSLTQLVGLRDELVEAQQLIEFGCSSQFIEKLTTQFPGDGDLKRIETLLATPLPTSKSRWKLLMAADQFGRELALSYALPLAFDEVEMDVPDVAPRQWDHLYRQAQLELKLVQLALWPQTLNAARQSTDKSSPTDATTARVAQVNSQLDAAFISIGDAQDSVTRYLAYRDFSEALSEIYVELGRVVDTFGPPLASWSRDMARHRSLASSASLFLLDPRDAWSHRQESVRRFTQRVELFDLLQLQQLRFEQAAALSLHGESEYLTQIAANLRASSSGILRRQAGTTAPRPEITSNPVSISLVNERSRNLTVTVTNGRSSPSDVWVILHYDPTLVSVTSSADVHHEHLTGGVVLDTLRTMELGEQRAVLSQSLALNNADKTDVDALREHKHFELPADGAVSIPLTVTRRSTHANATGLVVKVISGSTLTPRDSEFETTLAYARRRIDVSVPDIDLYVSSGDHTWSMLGDVITLHPFPNQKTGYQFQPILDGPPKDPVKVDVYALNQPLRRAGPTDDDAILRSATKLGTFEFGPSSNDPAAEDTSTSTSATDTGTSDSSNTGTSEPTPDSEQEPPSGHPANDGLALVSYRNGQQLVRYVRLMVQRPSRYVVPVVGYNARQERIEIQVRARDRDQLPLDDVVVRCRIAGDNASSFQGMLRGELNRSIDEARLHVDLPLTPPRRVTVYLDVDQFPRAFIYDVWNGQDTRDIPERRNLLTARIAPRLDRFWKGPLSRLPFSLELDLPHDSFQDSGDQVRLRIESGERDTLKATPWTVLGSDREVAVFVEEVSASGEIVIRADVKDFQLELPANQLSNVPARVTAHLLSLNRQRSMTLAQFEIDSEPPMLAQIDVRPYGGTVLAGSEFAVTVRAMDRMSGVDRVSVGFESSDEDSANPQLLPAIPVADDLWSVTLPTEGVSGSQKLLVRAEDRVGNSVDRRMAVTVLSEKQMQQHSQALAMKLTGRVTYVKEAVSNAAVSLEPVEGGEARLTRTDEGGTYQFDQVVAGKYRLSVRGVIRNVPRLAAQEFMVEFGPGGIQRLNVALD